MSFFIILLLLVVIIWLIARNDANHTDLHLHKNQFDRIDNINEVNYLSRHYGSHKHSGLQKYLRKSKYHLVLLGDSILDNAAYTDGLPSVTDCLVRRITDTTKISLLAEDGSIVEDIAYQLEKLPSDATNLVLSVGGNNALKAAGMVIEPVETVQAALIKLSAVHREFQRKYRAMLWMVAERKLPLVVCTIYDAVPDLGDDLKTALCLFNDVITREAMALNIPIIDLRTICTEREDYSARSPIEPSSQGSEKIAQAIINRVIK